MLVLAETRGAHEEMAAAQIGRVGLTDPGLVDFHMAVHVALRSPALEAVRISDAARMIAFWIRE